MTQASDKLAGAFAGLKQKPRPARHQGDPPTDGAPFVEAVPAPMPQEAPAAAAPTPAAQAQAPEVPPPRTRRPILKRSTRGIVLATKITPEADADLRSLVEQSPDRLIAGSVERSLRAYRRLAEVAAGRGEDVEVFLNRLLRRFKA